MQSASLPEEALKNAGELLPGAFIQNTKEKLECSMRFLCKGEETAKSASELINSDSLRRPTFCKEQALLF